MAAAARNNNDDNDDDDDEALATAGNRPAAPTSYGVGEEELGRSQAADWA